MSHRATTLAVARPTGNERTPLSLSQLSAHRSKAAASVDRAPGLHVWRATPRDMRAARRAGDNHGVTERGGGVAASKSIDVAALTECSEGVR